MSKKSFLRLALPILIIAIVFCAIFLNQTSVSAASCGGVETSIIECGDKESGIGAILKTVINVMSIGIGILAVIGITVVGIQYLTAGANEEQVRKSKRRLIEIVIGIIAYVLLYALLQWLIPGSTDPDDIPYYEPVETPVTQETPVATTPGSSFTETKQCTAFDDWIPDKGTRVVGYYLHIPQGANQNTPILIYLHGGGEADPNYYYKNLNNLKSVQELRKDSQKQFIAIIPNGHMTASANWTSEWTEDDVKGLINGSGVGKEISEKLKSCGGVSGRDKYIIGMSDGAIMTWTMVQKYSIFKAAAPVAGARNISNNLNNFATTRIVAIVGSGDSGHSMKTQIDDINNKYPNMYPIQISYTGKDHTTITSAIDYNILFNCLLSKDNNSSACDFGSGTTRYPTK